MDIPISERIFIRDGDTYIEVRNDEDYPGYARYRWDIKNNNFMEVEQ